MRVPVATYRAQFNSDLRFEDATRIVPHLHRLGITHLYASPIWAAREGSLHGYDVVDPNRLNPALGTREDFDQLVAALQSRDMGLIVDIVPNHMAASHENPWWMDVLEKGPASPYARYFGIDWRAVRHSHGEKIFLPVLGEHYGTVLESGQIHAGYSEDGFFISYYELKLPIAEATYGLVLKPHAGSLDEMPALEVLLRSPDQLKRRLWELYTTDPRIREYIDRNVELINGRPGDPASFDRLDDLLEQQAYRIAFWRAATERMNYRRFFDVSDLIAVRIEDPEVFRACHTLVFDLINDGSVQGLRIDHIDGLADPEGYIQRLPEGRAYFIAEKILVDDERLPQEWKLQGSTGYDFLGHMNALFIDPAGLEQIGGFYAQHTGITRELADVAYERRLLIINKLFAGEMENLGTHLEGLAEHDRYARDFSPRELSQGLKEVTACMPVYRTYTRSYAVSDRDRRYLQIACDEARRRCPQVDSLTYDFISRVLQLEFRPGMSELSKLHWLRFVTRWQQLSGPIMAKGVEDSAFYVYNRLVSLNEVGGIPHAIAPERMHSFLAERQALWPDTMNASSTHDTKRSEDVRARINVLSEIPTEWSRSVSRWSRWMRDERRSVDLNEEYFYFQNLVGAWPLFPREVSSFRERMKAYSTKAAREAREYTNWLTPSAGHERDLHSFLDAFFENERVLSAFLALQQKTAFFGAVNALSQVLLKITAPGLPDFYRGTMEWDFSLVDPDNRRPVTFGSLTDFDERARSLLGHWQDGRVKVFLTERALAFRKAHAELFRHGDYIPVAATGKRADSLFAFIRRKADQSVLVVVPRLVSKLSTVLRFPTGITAWRDTQLMLPEGSAQKWKNVLTGGRLSARDSALPMHRVLEQFPVALLASK